MTNSPAGPTTGQSRVIFTVSRLNREAKLLLESGLGLVWLEGEISNLAKPASGHLYFSLKDNKAQVRCALFRGKQQGLSFHPEDGMQVVARARVSLYEPRGEFQLIVESLEPAGEGELRRRFERLKLQLQAEGLFQTDRKAALPALPTRIGIITSPGGAVIHDIITTLARRFPAIPLLLYPVAVQGKGAAEEIAAMIALASRRAECDAMILARGGGSLEDLWAFNEEVVARAIDASRIPIVSAVGHETDFTIADMVADTRAPTPTAAAEMLSPDQTEISSLLRFHWQRLQGEMIKILNEARQATDWASMRLTHPRERINRALEKLVNLSQRQEFLVAARIQLIKSRLQSAAGHIHFARMSAKISRLRLDTWNRGQKLCHIVSSRVQRDSQLLQGYTGRLHALSPLATMNRGYSILTQTEGKVIRNTKGINPGDKVHARLARGGLDCVVEDVHEPD
ncbi:MAG: exodeoxyribonuclease VII large subunit [Acidiferrobacterales bacterium]